MGMEDKTVPAVTLGEVGGFAVPHAVASVAVPAGSGCTCGKKTHAVISSLDEGGGVT